MYGSIARTRIIYLISKILLGPQLVLFSLLLFILNKKLGATPTQLAVATAFRPLSALPAYLLGYWLMSNLRSVRGYLVVLTALAVIPSLLLPFISHPWYVIAVSGLYMVATKAMVPPWIEFVKRELERNDQSNLFATGNAIYYLANFFLPLPFSLFLDHYPDFWYLLFMGAALFKALSLPLVLKFPPLETRESFPLRSIFTPLLEYPDFVRYLFLFFVGGSSFVLLEPVLPLYFQDVLNFSYTEVAFACSLCKAVAFLATTPFWAKLSHRYSLYALNAFFLGICLCYIGLLSVGLVAFAYLFYGALQGGSELSWTLSGPHFSKDRESISLTSLNYLFGGVRGVFLPFTGMFIYESFGANALFCLATLPALWGIVYGISLTRRGAKSPSLV